MNPYRQPPPEAGAQTVASTSRVARTIRFGAHWLAVVATTVISSCAYLRAADVLRSVCVGASAVPAPAPTREAAPLDPLKTASIAEGNEPMHRLGWEAVQASVALQAHGIVLALEHRDGRALAAHLSDD